MTALNRTAKGEYPRKGMRVLVWDGSQWELAVYTAGERNPDYFWDGDTWGLRDEDVKVWTPLPRKPRV